MITDEILKCSISHLADVKAVRSCADVGDCEIYSDRPTGRLALVFELMEMNIYELIRGRCNYVAEDRIKSYMYQLMKGWHFYSLMTDIGSHGL